MKKVTVIRREHFNAAHRLYRKDWSDEKNREVFGLCSNPNYHGHNYHLEISVTGELDPETGYVIDLKIVKDLLKSEVLEKFDHKNLNEDTEEFRELNPTAENIAIVIYDKLKKKLDPGFDVKVRLSETERNLVEYPAG
jgi:6-pyruvoyltetrahydropterin/6-carboxytetrahydropterin synthase